VTAVILGVAFLDDIMTWRMLGGMALIGLALVTIDGRLLQRS
jgi:drug/metabolite transporter (DMT)-like permease